MSSSIKPFERVHCSTEIERHATAKDNTNQDRIRDFVSDPIISGDSVCESELKTSRRKCVEAHILHLFELSYRDFDVTFSHALSNESISSGRQRI